MLGIVSLTLAMTAADRASFCGAFDDDDVIALVDGDAVMAAALDVVDAVGELLDRDGHGGGVKPRTWSGTGDSTAGFAVTFETVMSSTG